jgi:hypothetical protein
MDRAAPISAARAPPWPVQAHHLTQRPRDLADKHRRHCASPVAPDRGTAYLLTVLPSVAPEHIVHHSRRAYEDECTLIGTPHSRHGYPSLRLEAARIVAVAQHGPLRGGVPTGLRPARGSGPAAWPTGTSPHAGAIRLLRGLIEPAWDCGGYESPFDSCLHRRSDTPRPNNGLCGRRRGGISSRSSRDGDPVPKAQRSGVEGGIRSCAGVGVVQRVPW